MSTVYMIYLPRLIYISTSLLTVFHPRRVFSRVFSSLCLLLLCFWMMLTSIPWTNFTLFIYVVCFISSTYYCSLFSHSCVSSCVMNNDVSKHHTTKVLYIIHPHRLFDLECFCCFSIVVSLFVVLMNGDPMNPLSPMITKFTLFILTTSSA